MPVFDISKIRKSQIEEKKKKSDSTMDYLNKNLFKFISRQTFYEELYSYEIWKEEEIIGYFINYRHRTIPEWYFREKGWKLKLTKRTEHILLVWSLLEVKEIFITEDFWTCDCEDHWIHTLAQTSCPVCYFTYEDDTKRNVVITGGELK